PCAGAWIETASDPGVLRTQRVAPCAGAWIETWRQSAYLLSAEGRPLRGGVDRNSQKIQAVVSGGTSPPARGRGSKRATSRRSPRRLRSRPLRGGVDRNVQPPARVAGHRGRPLRGGVDRNRGYIDNITHEQES